MKLPVCGMDHPVEPALIQGVDYRVWGAELDKTFLIKVGDWLLTRWLRRESICAGDKGYALNIIHEYQLWKAGGYRSFAALSKAKIDYSSTTIQGYRRKRGPKMKGNIPLRISRSIAHMGADLKRIFSPPMLYPEDLCLKGTSRESVVEKLDSLSGDWRQNLLVVMVELINCPVPVSTIRRYKGRLNVKTRDEENNE